MTFPDAPRVVYEKNVLEEVKCQVRFPPILQIDNSPTEFQNLVRYEFPYFEVRAAVKNLPTGVPQEISQVFERDVTMGAGKTYHFISEDKNLTVLLNRSELSLVCRKYSRWEPLHAQMAKALDALGQVYRPAFFNHTCVRFKNAVLRSKLGLNGVPWSRLINPSVSGLLATHEIGSSVDAQQCRYSFNLENIGRVDAAFGLGFQQITKEQAFLIETHIFNDSRKEMKDVLQRLDTLHGQARLLFRWCITDELDAAMLPKPC